MPRETKITTVITAQSLNQRGIQSPSESVFSGLHQTVQLHGGARLSSEFVVTVSSARHAGPQGTGMCF